MKRTMISMLTLLAAGVVSASPMNSEIKLQGGGEAGTGGGVVKIALDQLIPNAAYNVQCHVTSNADVDMRFDIQVASGARWGYFYLNGVLLDSQQGTSKVGDNVSEIRNLSSAGANNNLIFTNLDGDNSVKVSNCTAVPVKG